MSQCDNYTKMISVDIIRPNYEINTIQSLLILFF